MIRYLILILLIITACSKPTAVEEPISHFEAKPVLVPEQEVKTLTIGSQAPDFSLPATDGRFYSLNDFNDSQVLAIIFTCNHCPTAQAYEERIKSLVDDYTTEQLQVIGISPNSPLGLLYEELGYSDLGDTFDDQYADHS